MCTGLRIWALRFGLGGTAQSFRVQCPGSRCDMKNTKKRGKDLHKTLTTTYESLIRDPLLKTSYKPHVTPIWKLNLRRATGFLKPSRGTTGS